MLKLLGAALMVGGGAWAGLNAAGELSRRARALEAWCGALELMENELTFRLPAMPELAQRLSRSARAPAREVFLALQKGLERLGEASFEELWREALTACPGGLGGEELDILQTLGAVLGRYGGEDQCRSLKSARRALAERGAQVREELRRKGKAYAATGVALGALATILLL